MVAIMAAKLREKVAGLLDSAKSSRDLNSKLQSLHHLNLIFSDDVDTDLLSEFLPPLLDFHFDSSSPFRKFVIDTPAVARQSGTCGINLFRSTLVRIAIQGIYSSELDDSLKLSWAWMLKFKDEIYTLASKPGSDGRRLVALKFVAATILLYTPDPSGSSEPPSNHSYEEKFDEFNMAWLRRGHPVLDIGDSSTEASKSLDILLDQLRYSTVKSLNNSAMIVLINSLSEIARKRPALYGRIMAVLLALDPSSSANKGMHVLGAHYPLKNAFLACLKCTHPGAAPWRDRLVGALKEMKAGDLAEEALHEVCQINGSVGYKNNVPAEEEKPLLETVDYMSTDIRRKRSVTPDVSDLAEEDEISGKRARRTPEAKNDQDKLSSSVVSTSRGEGDNGPVQQLVSMFAALVSQGEKAVGSLQILISSISADLLAEVVMANMRHLPSVRPKDEDLELDKDSRTSYGFRDTQFKKLSSFLREIQSTSSPFQQRDSVLDAHPAASNDLENPKLEEKEQKAITLTHNDARGPLINETAIVPAPTDVPVSSCEGVPSANDVSLAIAPKIPDIGLPENGIPGLESSTHSYGLSETLAVSSLVATDLEEASQDQVNSLGRSSQDIIPSISTDRSEELSPKAACMDTTSINSSTATSLRLPSQLVLPKMSAPVISLDGEQMDSIQKMSFMRIVEAYKHIAVAGGSQVRFSLLAYLGVALPFDVDPWKMVETHVLSDYMNHEGHELTLRVLYKLFGEAEANADFLYSTNATSVYEMFLLKVAETLRDAFPASDKSLSRLLGEVPYLPKSILKLLECLCCPGNNDKDEKVVHSGDRVTQGLSTVWSLILLRPPTRDVCLKIALQSAVHHLEEVRMKAIRLVANKLYPISSLTQSIEDYAKEMMISATSAARATAIESQKEHLNVSVSEATVPKDVSSDTHQLNTCESSSLSSVSEKQRCMSLYFALCTKKHSLFREVFVVYDSMSEEAKQAVHGQIPILVRTIGTSSQLLEIISDPPTGSGNLLLQVIQTLTDGTVPSPELISTIRKLYDSNVKDAQILIPVLPFLPKHEVLLIFPHLVNLPLDKFQAVLARALQGSSQSGPVLTPGEVLIAIHKVDPEKEGIPLKKVTDACTACFEQGQIFTQQVLAEVLNQLVEQIPLPLLFMRTVLQTIGVYPSLVDFVMNILSRLVSKQIWKTPKMWAGFLRCVLSTMPQCFGVLLQLPPSQLENAMNKIPVLKAPLVAHASRPDIQSSLPRSVLVVLGIVSDSQSASPMETAQPPSAEGSTSDKMLESEKSKETSTISET
ncbi:hypothetical protein AgCh_035073 [Apium graveolens]